MKSFTTFLPKIILEIARSAAICVNQPQNWRASYSALSDDMRITAREQALSHPPFASEKANKKLLQHQRRYRKTLNLVIHNDCVKLQEAPFTGPQKN